MDTKSLSHTRWKCQYHIGEDLRSLFHARMRYHPIRDISPRNA